MRRLNRLLAGGLLLTACVRSEPGDRVDEPPGAEVGAPLVHSLEVGVASDTVRFSLHLTNVADTAVVLEYPTAQRYDFEIRSPADELVWRWSADRGFAQMLGEETLAAGESVQYHAEWPAGGPGRYVAIGRVTSSSAPIELRTEFEIPVP